MDLFVNIFQILGPNCKILGLRVDFEKAEGPKWKISEIPRIMNYFSTDKVMDWVHAW
jgi:aminoglycoside/choline kinase family phosphotransferase